MTSDECRLLIPQYLSGELPASEYASLEEHLESNADLGSEMEELRLVWEKLGLLPQAQPSPALRAQFYQRLNAIERDRQGSKALRFNWPLKLWAQIAVGVFLFASGLFLGRIKTPADRTAHTEIAAMSAQVQNLRELVALSLLERQSAASRLEGVAYSNGIDRPNGELVSALLLALNHDANVNVRLSSIDALERFTKNAVVGKALVDSIEQQDSPLVQIALIDSLVSVRNHAVAGELRKLTAATGVNTAVRQRAQWGLQKLTFE